MLSLANVQADFLLWLWGGLHVHPFPLQDRKPLICCSDGLSFLFPVRCTYLWRFLPLFSRTSFETQITVFFFTSSWEHNSINHITIRSRKFSMGTNEFLCYFLNNTVTAALQWLIWILLGDDVTKNMPHANTYTHTGLHKFATIKSTSWAMLLAHE